jgi:hypothetical protein
LPDHSISQGFRSAVLAIQPDLSMEKAIIRRHLGTLRLKFITGIRHYDLMNITGLLWTLIEALPHPSRKEKCSFPVLIGDPVEFDRETLR